VTQPDGKAYLGLGNRQAREAGLKNCHLTEEGNTWNLRPEGGTRPVVHAETKVEALGQVRAYMNNHPHWRQA
jgi:hypothetical protein